MTSLADSLDDLLPQTQCTQCGFAGCRPYAEAMAAGTTEINRCSPGGQAGVAALALATGRPEIPLDLSRGTPGPLLLAVIDESLCIGCTLCIRACPTDAIVGASKRMHSVLADWCTGCELCIPPCPMDCIRMEPAGRDWTRADAELARARHQARAERLLRDKAEHDARLASHAVDAPVAQAENTPAAAAPAPDAKLAMIQAAMERARARRTKV